MNRSHKNLVISHPGYENRIPKLSSKKNLRAAMSLLRRDRSVRAELIRDRVAEIRRLNEKIGALDKQMAAKVKASGTSLTQLRGYSVHRGREDPWRGGGSLEAPVQGIVRDAHGHRSTRGLFGQNKAPPAQSRREPSAQLRAPHDGACALPRRRRYKGVHGPASGRGQVSQGSTEMPQEAPVQRRLSGSSSRIWGHRSHG
jgi:hypothetical protein